MLVGKKNIKDFEEQYIWIKKLFLRASCQLLWHGKNSWRLPTRSINTFVLPSHDAQGSRNWDAKRKTMREWNRDQRGEKSQHWKQEILFWEETSISNSGPLTTRFPRFYTFSEQIQNFCVIPCFEIQIWIFSRHITEVTIITIILILILRITD